MPIKTVIPLSNMSKMQHFCTSTSTTCNIRSWRMCYFYRFYVCRYQTRCPTRIPIWISEIKENRMTNLMFLKECLRSSISILVVLIFLTMCYSECYTMISVPIFFLLCLSGNFVTFSVQFVKIICLYLSFFNS